MFLGKYAHFEYSEGLLEQVYTRHAEVTRDIHQDVLRELTGDPNIVVDLVPMSPIRANQEVLDKLAEYDVVSVSTGSTMHSGIRRADNVVNTRQYFAQNDMPIYVVASGNDGEQDEIGSTPRVADFSRTSLVVSEAGFDEKGAFIEDLSNWRKTTLASDNPLNRGKSYQIVDPSPSLDGHESLIKDWLIRKTDLNDEEIVARVNHYMAHPDELHKQVLTELRKKYEFDERGYSSSANGTSFSSPETGAYMSKAHWDQEQREEKNLPVLSKEEISTLARLATVDTNRGENDKLIHTYNNRASFQITGAGGHGVFHPDMFNALLQKAYETLENTPDIDRHTVDATYSSKSGIRDDTKETALSSDFEKGQQIVIERMRIDFSMTGTNPTFVFYGKPGMETTHTPTEIAGGVAFGAKTQGWARIESSLGEVIDGGGEMRFRTANAHSVEIHDASITVYGYNEGGFMHQMMKHSQDIMPEFMPKPETVEPEIPAETLPQDTPVSDVPSSLPRAR